MQGVWQSVGPLTFTASLSIYSQRQSPHFIFRPNSAPCHHGSIVELVVSVFTSPVGSAVLIALLFLAAELNSWDPTPEPCRSYQRVCKQLRSTNTTSSFISFYSTFVGEPPPEMNSLPQLLVFPPVFFRPRNLQHRLRFSVSR